MKIEVTQEHIDKVLNYKKDYRCTNCPVALATAEATGQYCEVYGKYGDTMFVGQKEFKKPLEVKRFVLMFDSLLRTAAEPFEFELPLEELE